MSHSDTRIVYGSGATFWYQDRNMRIGVSRSDTRIVYGSGATFRYQDRIYGSGATFRYQDRIYGSGATFRYQDRMRIRVSRSDTRIVYEKRSVTYQHEGNKYNES